MNQIEDILTRGVVEVIDKANLIKALESKTKLRVKLGIDPTSPNIHIGRAVVLRKLKAFQDLGHKIVFIVGDFTGLVGDTSDKDSERPMLSEKEVKANMKTYFEQAFKILDKSKTETHYNSEWLKKLGFIEIVKMASLFGLHEFESRDVIARRMKLGKRVSFHELMYPLMQGYDSVAVKADVELGGIDQKFNLLAGRVIQKAYGQEPQNILMTDILEGTDGRKMSSSWGNTVNLTDSPENMFGKIMSIPDNLIERYFLLATALPENEIQKVLKDFKNPRDQKLLLAEKVTTLYNGEKKAEQAKEGFVNQFSKGELPSEIETKKIKPGEYAVVDLILLSGLVTSKSEAKRLLEQNGVKINQKNSKNDKVKMDGKTEILLQVGKRKYIKLI